MRRLPPRATLFPYATLFRSCPPANHGGIDTLATPPEENADDPEVENLLGKTAKRKDRKSTRLNSSHANISYAGFCLKKQHYHNYRAAHIFPLAHHRRR